MMARFYSPTFRRFLSEDPIGFAGGINLYAYTAGDPVNFIDPDGKLLRAVVIGVGLGLAARIVAAHIRVNTGVAEAITVFPYVPLVVKSPETLAMSEPYNAAIDAHEAVHWGSIEGFYSEKLAHIQQAIVAESFLDYGYYGRELTPQERLEVQGALEHALDYLRSEYGIEHPSVAFDQVAQRERPPLKQK